MGGNLVTQTFGVSAKDRREAVRLYGRWKRIRDQELETLVFPMERSGMVGAHDNPVWKDDEIAWADGCAVGFKGRDSRYTTYYTSNE